MKRNAIAVFVAAALCAACFPIRPIQSPIERVQQASFSELDSQAEATDSFLKTNSEAAAIEEAVRSVKKQLKDPDSAKIQNVRLVKYGASKVICGEVNGKNSFGAYTGYKPFVASPYAATFYDSSSRYPAINEASNAGIVAACY